MTDFLDSKAWWAERSAKTRAAEEQSSAVFFADPEAKIPDLVFAYPDCPICLRETDFDDGYFTCEVCRVQWPSSGYGSQAERWEE